MKPGAARLLSEFRKPWLLAPDVLQDLRDIALRARAPDFEAVLAKHGEHLQGTERVIMRGNVAVVPVHGPIFRYANIFTDISGATSIEVLATDFRAALANQKVESIVLDVDSPGGQVTGVSEFAQMVRTARKPVTAYVGGMAASAGYWIASAASRVVVSDTAFLGSIGVVTMYLLDDDDSVVEIVSSQSPLKRIDVRTDEGRAVAQRQVDELATVFIERVAEHRRTTASRVASDFGRGDVLLGASAVSAGMADAIGTLEGTIAQYRGRATAAALAMPLLPLADLVKLHGLDKAAAMYAAQCKSKA